MSSTCGRLEGRLEPGPRGERTEERRLPNFLSSALFSPGYTLRDGIAFIRGSRTSVVRFWQPMMAYDARRLGTTFDTPLFYLQGALDLIALTQCVQEYVDSLQAPHKELVIWENEGHLTFLTNPELLHMELVTRVRPLAAGHV